MLFLATNTSGNNTNIDEIIELTIINDKNEVLFNQHFKPVNNTTYDKELTMYGNTPEELNKYPTFKECATDIIGALNTDNSIVCYDISNYIFHLDDNVLSCLQSMNVTDLNLEFSKIYGNYDKELKVIKWNPIETACSFYDYDLDTLPSSLDKVKGIRHLYNKLEERKLILNDLTNRNKAEDYAIKEFGKKIAFKYNPDFINGTFTSDDLNELFETFNNHLETGVEDLIKSTLHTNYIPQEIVIERNKSETKDLLTRINLDECLEDAKIRYDFKRALKCTDRVQELSYKLGWSFYNDDIKQLVSIYKEHPELQEKVYDLLEDCNFHDVNRDLEAGNYDKYLSDEPEEIQDHVVQ